MRRRISRCGWARVGSLRILHSLLPRLPVPTRRRPPGFPSSSLFGLAVPTGCPRPSRRLCLLDFVATTDRGRAPNKGTWLPAASPRTVHPGWWRDGDRLLGPGWGCRWAGDTDLAVPAVRHLPPNLRVTHGPAIMANGIPGGSPTRAPSSLGPREPPLPPFGEPLLGSIGRQLCLSRPGPRLPSRLRAGPGLRGPRGCLAPGCAHVEPWWVGMGGGAGLGVLGTCPGLRLGDDHCTCVCLCVLALRVHVEKESRAHTRRGPQSAVHALC